MKTKMKFFKHLALLAAIGSVDPGNLLVHARLNERHNAAAVQSGSDASVAAGYPPTTITNKNQLKGADNVPAREVPPVDLPAVIKEDKERETMGLAPRFAIPNEVKITPQTDGIWEKTDRGVVKNDPTRATSYLGTSSPGDSSHLQVRDWDKGTTEGGSSGSPLFDQNHHVVGQLHGGYAACGNDSADWYGWFNRSWTGGGSYSSCLKDHLDPENTGALFVDTLVPIATPECTVDNDCSSTVCNPQTCSVDGYCQLGSSPCLEGETCEEAPGACGDLATQTDCEVVLGCNWSTSGSNSCPDCILTGGSCKSCFVNDEVGCLAVMCNWKNGKCNGSPTTCDVGGECTGTPTGTHSCITDSTASDCTPSGETCGTSTYPVCCTGTDPHCCKGCFSNGPRVGYCK